MKKTIYNFLFASASLLLLASCNEELSMVEAEKQVPSISSFTPTSGAPGTIVTIHGQSLSRVDTVYFGGAVATIISKTNDKEMQAEVPASGSTGKLGVQNLFGLATSQEDFTYVYPTPSVSGYPSSGDVASTVVFTGENLASILMVKIGDVTAPIVSAKPNELAVRIPNIDVGHAEVQFIYRDGPGTTETITGSQTVDVTKTAPVFNLSGISDLVRPGDQITLTGESFEKIDSVRLGGARVNIMRITPDGRSIDLAFVDDKYLFDAGENTKSLIAYGLFGTEFPIKSDMKIDVPKVFVYKDCRLECGQNVGNTGKFFFNIEDGVSVSGTEWRSMDKPSYSRHIAGAAYDPSKGPHSASNRLVKKSDALPGGVSQEEYYSVPPYIYLIQVSSRISFVVPAGSATTIRAINANAAVSSPKTMDPNTQQFGTPIVLYRVLNLNVPAEKAVYDKVLDGTIADAPLSKSLIDSWAFTATPNGPGDIYGNQLAYTTTEQYGTIYGGKSAGHIRPPMGQFTAATHIAMPLEGPAPEVDIVTPEPVGGVYKEGSNVVLFLYFDYNYTGASAYAYESARVRKIGFMHIKKFNNGGPYEPDKGSNWMGRQMNNCYMIFDMYWQRTPEGGWAFPE